MILRSIRIGGWRCFSEPVEINGFTDSLNVVYAPNGTGKSTVIEALTLGMFDNHRVKGKDIESIRPWGRMLSPSVVIEFSNKDVGYRISKTFLDGAKSLLERMEGERYKPVAENDNADSMVRAMLTQSLPTRGLSKIDQRGLAQILWAPQGNLAPVKLSGDVIADIRAVLGSQASSSFSNPVERKIEALWGQYFTATGKLKSGREAPDLVRLREDLQKARDELTLAREQHTLFDETSRRVEDLRAKQRQTSSFAVSITEEITKTAARAKDYDRLDTERKQKAEQKKAAEAQYIALKQRVEAIAADRKNEAENRKLLDALEREQPARKEQLEKLQLVAEEVKRALENVHREQSEIASADSFWQEAADFLETGKKAAELRSRLDSIAQAQDDLVKCRQERASVIAPDKDKLWEIGKAIKDRDEARVHIEASSITLEIVPERDIQAEIISGDSSGTVSLPSGKPGRFTGSPEVSVDLPSVARIRARGPQVSIDRYRKALSEAECRMKTLTASYSTDNLDVLNDLYKQAEIIDGKIARAGTRLETLLGGERREVLQRELTMMDASIQEKLVKYPEWNNEKPDAHALKAALQQRNAAYITKIAAAEREWGNAKQAAALAEAEYTRTVEKAAQIRSDIQKIHGRLLELTTDGKTDEDRYTEMNRASLLWHSAAAGLEEIEKKLTAMGDNPAAALEKLEKQLSGAQAEASKTRDDEQRAEERLQMLSEHGTYTTLSLAEEKVEQLQHDIAAEELRLNAVHLMYSLLEESRNEIMAGITGPVEAAVSRILRRIAGSKLGRVKVNAEFALESIIPDDTLGEVAVTNASGGEQEQIYFAVRLALAEAAAGDERNLIILDDVLTATDAGRLARIMTIIEETAQRMQVLILTCHPERYSSLNGPRLIDLESIAQR